MNTALLIIDVQQSLVEEGIYREEEVVENINILISIAEDKNIPIVLIKDTRVKPDGSFYDELKQSVHFNIIDKSYRDAFMETSLGVFLADKKIEKIVIAGLQTEYCVNTTCCQAATLGYDILLVSDAHSTLDNEQLKARQIIAHHNRVLGSFDASVGKIRLAKTSEISFNKK